MHAPPGGRGARHGGLSSRQGQSLIESCLVIGLICLVFLGAVQLSQILAASEVLYHAAARGARAKAVGFNSWMVEKCVKVAAIPNAGALVTPTFVNRNSGLAASMNSLKPGDFWSSRLDDVPSSNQYGVEKPRIPDYLSSANGARARHILDYENWDDVRLHDLTLSENDNLIHVEVSQSYLNWVPLHRAFYAADRIDLTGESFLENHYPIYIDDEMR